MNDIGIVEAYDDVFGRRNEASDDTLVAVAGSLLGVPGASAREVAARLDEELADRTSRQQRLGSPVRVAWLDAADETAVIEVPGSSKGGPEPERVELPIGRHELAVGGSGERVIALVAPRRLPQLLPGERGWGLFAPVWSVWDHDDHLASISSLDRLSEWVEEHGARVLGTLPLLATYLDSPWDPSPYTPISRLWWNENHLDLKALGEAVRPEVGDPSRFDGSAQWQQVRGALGRLAERAWAPGSYERAALEAWSAQNRGAVRYGRFRAMVEREGAGWHSWSASARAGELPVSDDDPVALTYIYAQWALRRQLDDLAGRLRSRGQFLYLDLALGTHGDGFDTWEQPRSFAWGAAVGAPPDALFEGGQNWGFPPVHPEISRRDGHEYVASCLRAHMEVCGMLRIDHVMGLSRLFFVPDGMPATEGAYVRYPMEELMAVLSLEAHRSGCVVVGENLGTVPAEVDAAIERHGLYGMHVHQLMASDRPGSQDLASVNTHDTPTYAAWSAAGGDRAEPGEASPSFEEVALDLARSDAPMVILSIDDLVGEHEPQNVPGTPVDRPNWVVRTDRPFAELAADPEIGALLEGVNGARTASEHATGATDP